MSPLQNQNQTNQQQEPKHYVPLPTSSERFCSPRVFISSILIFIVSCVGLYNFSWGASPSIGGGGTLAHTPQQKQFTQIAKEKKKMKAKGIISEEGFCHAVDSSMHGNSSTTTSSDIEVLCSPCLSYSSRFGRNLDEYDLKITPNQNKFFSNNMYLDFDNTTTALIDNYKKYILGDKNRRQESLDHGRDFPSPCDLQNPRKDFLKIPIHTILSKMTFADAFRMYRNATIHKIFDTEAQPIMCMLALLHTENCNAEEESFQGCILRLGIENAEQLFPDLCRQRAFWHAYKAKILIPAEKRMVTGLRRKWQQEMKKSSSSSGETTSSSSNNHNHNKNNNNKHAATVVDERLKEFWEERRNGWKKMKRGKIPNSMCKATKDEKEEFIPDYTKRNIKPMNFGDPWICPRTNLTLHQIGFAVPRSLIVDKVTRTKAFDFMPLMPGAHLGDRNYKVGLNQEALLKELYASSYFSFTNVRGGVDTQRHFEILASGSVPFMPEIDILPKYSVSQLPKDLLRKVLYLPGVEHMGGAIQHRLKMNHTPLAEYYQPIHQGGSHINFIKRGSIDSSKFNPTEYFRIADALLEYTKRYLTCGSLVLSILERLGKPNAKKVLIVSRFAYDYLHQQVHVGVTELGIPAVVVGEDSARWTYRLSQCAPISEFSELQRADAVNKVMPYLYGNGLTMPLRAWDSGVELITKPESAVGKNLHKRIADREFDAVIYSYVYLGMTEKAPYLDTVKKHYSPGEVAFLDHDDRNFIGPFEYLKLSRIGKVFVRELDEKRSCIYK